MNRIQALKFYFVEWKGVSISVLVILLLALGFYSFSMLNVPSGESAFIEGTVMGVGQTHGSSLDLAYPSINVKLKNGEVIHIAIPREVTVKIGDVVKIKKSKLALGGIQHQYYEHKRKP